MGFKGQFGKPRIIKSDGHPRRVYNNVRIQDWADFQRVLAEMIASIEKIKSGVKQILEHEHIVAQDLSSLAEGMSANMANQDLLRTIRRNEINIKETLDGGGDVVALIPIIKGTYSEVSDFADNRDNTALDELEMLNKVKKSIGNDAAGTWIKLRSYLERMEGFEKLISEEIKKKSDDFLVTIVVNFIYINELVEKESTTDEAILYQLLDLSERLEDVRRLKNKDFDGFIAFGINNGNEGAINQLLKPHFSYNPSNYSSGQLRSFFTNIAKIKENYFRKFKKPISHRIEEIRELMDKSNGRFISMANENKKKALEFYDDWLSYMFDGTDYKDKFEQRQKSAKLEKLSTEYKDEKKKLLNKLLEHDIFPDIKDETREEKDLVIAKVGGQELTLGDLDQAKENKDKDKLERGVEYLKALNKKSEKDLKRFKKQSEKGESEDDEEWSNAKKLEERDVEREFENAKDAIFTSLNFIVEVINNEENWDNGNLNSYAQEGIREAKNTIVDQLELIGKNLEVYKDRINMSQARFDNLKNSLLSLVKNWKASLGDKRDIELLCTQTKNTLEGL